MEVYAREMDAFNDEACPFSTGGGTRRVRLVREAGGRGGGSMERGGFVQRLRLEPRTMRLRATARGTLVFSTR